MASKFSPHITMGIRRAEMQPRLVDLEKDYSTIAAWYDGYGQIAPLKSEFGPINFIVDDLALVGILRTESSITFLEPLIGNPKADKEARREAVDGLIEYALKFCALLNQKKVYVLTSNSAVSARKDKFNFEEVRKTTLYRRSL